ncbi:nucleotide-diphospho-sugar transferase [Spirosoma gilvum]
MANTIPVLIILFNRPDNAQQLIDRLRTIAPTKLFVAIDGPRVNRVTDKEKVDECIKLISKIDWPCEVHKKISTYNLGCGVNVSEAISWFFNEVEEGIILEDDCIPSQSFFDFCELTLAKYRERTEVMLISGNRWNEEFPIETDYFFSLFTSTWGWATWRRAWKRYDFTMNDWPQLKQSEYFLKWLNLPDIKKFWFKKLEAYYNHIQGGIDNWDFQWQYTIFKYQGLVVTPRENLVQNIGTEGVHTYDSQAGIHFKPTSVQFKVVKEPTLLTPDYDYDEYHCKQLLKNEPSIYEKLRFGLKQILAMNSTYVRDKISKMIRRAFVS